MIGTEIANTVIDGDSPPLQNSPVNMRAKSADGGVL